MLDEKEIDDYVENVIRNIIRIIEEYEPILIAGDGTSKGE